MKPVAIVGHTLGNIGHEIMVLGVESMVQAACGEATPMARLEQHRPYEVYPEGHPLRSAVSLQHARGGRAGSAAKALLNVPAIARLTWRQARTREFAAAIVCGGPVLVPGLSRGDLSSMYHHMLGAFRHHAVPVLNLSLGACLPWSRRDDRITDTRDRDFLKRMFAYSSVITVRDPIAEAICADLGFPAERIQDSGFMSGLALEGAAKPYASREEIVINYQRVGANEAWGQPIDPAPWRQTLLAVIAEFSGRHPIRFVCHSDDEMRLAEEIAPNLPRERPASMADYARVISNARVGLCNRIHAGVALSSIGTPVVGVAADTRMLTLTELGAECHYVGDVSAETLIASIHARLSAGASYHSSLMALRASALSKYIAVIRRQLQGAA